MQDPGEDLYADIADVRVGMHIHLDLSWLEHPFPQSSFKLRNAEQIATLKGLRLQRVRWSPHLSDLEANEPVQAEAVPAAPNLAPAHVAVPDEEDPAERQQREAAERAESQRRAMLQCQRALVESVRKVKSLSKTLHAQPTETRERAYALVDELAGGMLAEASVAIRLMADSFGGETAYHHALNVTLLSLNLARAMKAPPPVMRLIGVGAMLHDIGKFDIPDRITRKAEPLTKAEASWLQTHAAVGVELAKKMGLPVEAQQIVSQHHEAADGSGYPRKLKGSAISLPARIVAVANAFDNLCNPLHGLPSHTPHEALATLYGKRRAQFDEQVLGTFVRCMGIYPPGTLVRLSNERLGIVAAVHAERALKPTLILFDPTVPKERAPMLDLGETTDVSIVKTLRANEVDPLAREYLLLGARTAYYIGADPPAGA